MKIIGRIPPLLIYMLVSLSTLTETIYSAALPDIAEKLHTSGGIAQLSTTAYYCGFAIGIFTLGRVSDIFGRKPVVLFGISFYAICALLISYSPNIETFICLRFLQAYGASVGSVVGQAMTRDSYKGWELSYMYASVAMVMAVVPSIGSAIGGYIVEYSNWQYVFRFLTILATSLLLIYIRFLPETNAHIGVARNNRFFSVVKIALQDKVLVSYAFIVGAFNGICFGFYIQAPFIFIDNLKMSPSNYGQLFLLLSGANLIGSVISRRLIKKFVNTFKVKIIGFGFSIAGCIMLGIAALMIDNNTSINMVAILIFVPMTIHLMGHSLLVPMLLRHALEDYFKVVGSAGAIFGSLYYLITASVSFMISWLHSDTINNFSILFIILLITCTGLFYMTMQWRKTMHKPEFS
jgi:DHA1 family bicyclomycin/chloramphenicol resistance-like MFS transporter